MREDELVERWTSPYTDYSERVVLGIGDDAAIIKQNISRELLVSVDTSVEGIHFNFNLLTPEEVGYRALAAALSDLAAMGGKPLAVLLNVQVHVREVHRVEGVYRGFEPLLRRYCVDLVGGNVSKGREMVLTFTVLGEVHRGMAWKRRGAKPGDVVFLTGDVGRVKAFLLFSQMRDMYPQIYRELREKFVKPEPRFNDVERIRSEGVEVSAAIDVSDGLSLDLWRLAKSSGVNIKLDLESIPRVPSLSQACKLLGKDELDMALSSGEEYELVLCVPQRYSDKMDSLGYRRIGFVDEGEIGVFTQEGDRLEPKGWQHF